MKKNKTLKISIIVILLALIICSIFVIKHIQAPATDTNKTDGEQIEEDNINYIETNAYDFIIDEMTKSQVWSEEDIPPYPTNNPDVDITELAKKEMINGSGFELVDENTASFRRGYLSSLTLNFSNNTQIPTSSS